MTGFIYAVECAGRIKIGYSANPRKRLNKIAADVPFPCDLLGTWPGTISDELAAHAHLHLYRRHGEWFEATVEVLEFISARIVDEGVLPSRFHVTAADGALATWRKSHSFTLKQLADALEIGGGKNPSRRVQRIELGEAAADALLQDRIVELTKGAVSIEELHGTRRDWLQGQASSEAAA